MRALLKLAGTTLELTGYSKRIGTGPKSKQVGVSKPGLIDKLRGKKPRPIYDVDPKEEAAHLEAMDAHMVKSPHSYNPKAISWMMTGRAGDLASRHHGKSMSKADLRKLKKKFNKEVKTSKLSPHERQAYKKFNKHVDHLIKNPRVKEVQLRWE